MNCIMETLPEFPNEYSFNLTEQELLDLNRIMRLGEFVFDRETSEPLPANKAWKHFPYRLSQHTLFLMPDLEFQQTCDKFVDRPYWSTEPSYFHSISLPQNEILYKKLLKPVEYALSTLKMKRFYNAIALFVDTNVPSHTHAVPKVAEGLVVTETYYWTLTDNPISSNVIYNDEPFPLQKHGKLTFDPSIYHSVESVDNNTRLFMLFQGIKE